MIDQPGSGVAALPPLRDVISRFGLDARRSLGQNFLLDLNLTGKIARAAGALEDCTVIEIGPGPGGLTRALLLAGAKHVVAIERDERCLGALAEVAAVAGGRLQVVPGDALEIDPATLGPAPRRIVANLPYNIATTLLLRWLPRVTEYEGLTLMFQKEVAQRLAAAPGSHDYGRLSVAAQFRAHVRALFDVSPKAFVPAPKVTSTVVEVIPRAVPLAPCDPAVLERVTAAAFGQRRKMLRGSLRTLGVDTERLIASAGLIPTARAEELSVLDFCALARAYSLSDRSAAG